MCPGPLEHEGRFRIGPRAIDGGARLPAHRLVARLGKADHAVSLGEREAGQLAAEDGATERLLRDDRARVTERAREGAGKRRVGPARGHGGRILQPGRVGRIELGARLHLRDRLQVRAVAGVHHEEVADVHRPRVLRLVPGGGAAHDGDDGDAILPSEDLVADLERLP